MIKQLVRYLPITALIIFALVIVACGTPTTPAPAPTNAPAVQPTVAPAQATTAPAQPTVATVSSTTLADLASKVFSKGPNGEEPTAASTVTLSDDELAKIKAMKATAAIVMHYGGNDWSVAQIDGLKTQFAKMGIEVIATTDANFKPEKQVSDIETVLAKNPSIIVSIPTDPVATADAYKKAADAGVKLVFMDNVPKGLQQGKDYVSVVSADNYGNGVAAAHLMAQQLGGKGKIGIVFHAADFFVTRQRYDAFKKTIQDNYPDIQIVAEQGIGGPDFAGDAEKVASAMLTKNADLNGIWAVWDVPAEGVMAAIRSSGRNEVIVTTIDLGKNVAIEIAKDGIVKGLGAQRPFDQGVTEALLAGYGLLGKQAPPYVALFALPVTKDSVLTDWTTVYHQDPPADLKAASGGSSSSGGATDPTAALAELKTKVYSTGPNGEVPTAASTLSFTDDELAKIKAMKATAAIVMHYGGNDWSVAQIDGLKTQFAKMGIEVIATTDANFKPEKQVSDIETVLAKNPNIIVSIPTDPVATADAYKKAAAAGVKLVFMDNVPAGLKQGTDYVSVVSADNYGNGVAAAHLMAQQLGGKGKIGIIFHAADFFVTRQRYDAFKKTIQDNYKDITIVEEQGIGGPDFAGDAEKAASAMLTKHADLNGIWAVWDVPAEGVMAAIRSSGRNEVIVTTIDLGKTVAIEISKGGIVKGLGAQRPFDQGVAEAILAGYGLLGKVAPAYVALNALPVTKDNILEAWTIVYHQDPPAELK